MSSKKGSKNYANAELQPLSTNYAQLLLVIASHAAVLYGLLTYPLTKQIIQLTIAFYITTMFAVTAGYHRLFAHQSYHAAFPLRFFFVFQGAAAFIGSVRQWAQLHRAHHRYIDTNKDPFNIQRGFFHAHIGWKFTNFPRNFLDVDVSDLAKDILVRWQGTFYYVLAPVSGLLVPAYIAHVLFNDFYGGLFFAGAGHILLVQHAFFLTQSLAHVQGFQPYSDENSSHDNYLVSLLTFGEGYQNYNHEFPRDYRLGLRMINFDTTKWFILALSFFGLTSNLQRTDSKDVLKTRVSTKQRKIEELKRQLDFGPEPEQLPVWSWDTITKKVQQGAKLIVVDGLVHDVGNFISSHPGGIRILQNRIGKDATIAFNGGLYRHTKAARNVAALLRVAKLPKEEIDLRVQSDDSKEE